jgi:hypothetical protein
MKRRSERAVKRLADYARPGDVDVRERLKARVATAAR